MQEVRAVVIAHIRKECRLAVVQRLCHAAMLEIGGAGHLERLAQIRLSRKDIAVAKLCVGEGDNLLNARLHLARDRRPVAPLLVLIVVRRLNRLCLERLLDVLHAGECRFRRFHPRDPRLDAVLIAVILTIGDIVAQEARVTDRVIGRTVQLAAVTLLHEFRLFVVDRVQISLVTLHHVVAANTDHNVTSYLPTMPVPLISLSSISSIDVSTREHAP